MLIGKVDYKPLFGNEINSDIKVKHKGLRKDRSYIHENEVRILAKSEKSFEMDNWPTGIRIPLSNLNDLRLEIIAHPKMKLWQKENLKEVLDTLLPDKLLNDSAIKIRP